MKKAWTSVVLSLLLMLCATAADLPSQVTSRLKKIDEAMVKVEQALEKSKADHNNLERAQQALLEIDEGYAAHAKAPEVQAARERIRKGEEAIRALEAKTTEQAQQKQSSEKELEAQAEAWADRLAKYKADNTVGAPGEFACPSTDIDRILACRAYYEEAKTLYEEFKASGIDPDSHWRLREAEYDLRMGLEQYPRSIGYTFDQNADNIKQGAQWIAGQKGQAKPNIHGGLRMQEMSDQMDLIRKLLPEDDARLVDLEATWKQLVADQDLLEAKVLKDRKMKPDAYKGGDAAAIKSLARKIVKEAIDKLQEGRDEPLPFELLNVHVTSAEWNTESALEWTDSTRSALQYRVTKGLNVQVACLLDGRCFVYTLFVHRDRVDGEAGDLVGHVMFRDKFLRENLPK